MLYPKSENMINYIVFTREGYERWEGYEKCINITLMMNGIQKKIKT